MKKFFTTLLVAVGLMSATTASAQVQFGVKAGVKLSLGNSDFPIKVCEARYFLFFCCFVVDIHRCFDISMPHNFLDYF